MKRRKIESFNVGNTLTLDELLSYILEKEEEQDLDYQDCLLLIKIGNKNYRLCDFSLEQNKLVFVGKR